MVTVITYGTFDTLHYGHINLLLNARNLGDKLIVALSSDEFNATKGKTSHFNYDVRKRYLDALTCVDLIIPEMSWEQKVSDIKKYNVDIFTMGSDWTGKFDELSDLCKVEYLGRTPAISSTLIKENIPTSQPGISRNQ